MEFIGKGLCHILDVAVLALKAVELACGWISAAIQFVLTQLFSIHRYVVLIRCARSELASSNQLVNKLHT